MVMIVDKRTLDPGDVRLTKRIKADGIDRLIRKAVRYSAYSFAFEPLSEGVTLKVRLYGREPLDSRRLEALSSALDRYRPTKGEPIGIGIESGTHYLWTLWDKSMRGR
jgi:hypothetical protein